MNTLRFSLDRTEHNPIHLAAQGSWQIDDAVALNSDQHYTFSALNALSGFSYAEGAGWFTTIILDPVEQISMKLAGSICHLEFSAEQVELRSASHYSATWEESLGWIRSQIGLEKKTRRTHSFDRVFCLDIHDSQGNLLQTFSDLRKLKQLTDERELTANSLFYLPGWDGKYDGTYPDYEASSDAGGWENLIEIAHALRSAKAEVFLHLNHWGISEDRLEKYPALNSRLLLDQQGKPVMWPGATWCGATNPLYYIYPDAPEWMSLMREKVRFIEDQGIRGFFFDQLGAFPGMKASQAAQVFAHEVFPPGNIYGMEAPMPELADMISISQWWGAPWCGVKEKPGLKMSSLLADVYAPWTQMVGHLGTPAPYPMRYSWTNYVFLVEQGIPKAFSEVWDAHRAAHVLPTLRLDSKRTEENALLLDRLFSPSGSPLAA